MIILDDVQDPYENDEDVMGNIQGGNVETKLNGQRAQVTPLEVMETMKSFNERFTKAQEEKHQINVGILQSLKNLHHRANLGLTQNNGSKDRKSVSSHSHGIS